MIFNGFRSVFSPNSKLGVSFLKYSFSATPSLPKVQVFLALRTEALLGDAGYSWPSSGDGLQQGKKELFNYRHSSLRNIIERYFGVLKARLLGLAFQEIKFVKWRMSMMKLLIIYGLWRANPQ
ncbi:uncharacterized protein LOC115696947 isoform X2 [Cannabis sativa]|uniref:uncharacterized protein LOC115696947 isoform X2 n=1 Tax=Cannabis sativa TaxID=3483 RepID=UPI0011DF21FD|nr:uncharacterized protein LOC115696947 isoform X2 [Cannabis sativa]